MGWPLAFTLVGVVIGFAAVPVSIFWVVSRHELRMAEIDGRLK